MEALGALGIAAAIVQFIEFGTTIIKGANAIYSSTSGTTEVNRRLDKYSTNPLELSRNIELITATSQDTACTSRSSGKASGNTRFKGTGSQLRDRLRRDPRHSLRVEGSGH